MRRVWAIAGREYASFFRVPLGWIVVALFLVLSGMIFSTRTVIPGEPATMRSFFTVWWGLLLFLAPAISMRLFSEEIRTGTIEPLMTSPIADALVVLGKYFAAVLFLLTMLAPTLVYVVVLEALARPDPGPIVAGYLGIVLLGMLYIAVGTLASALTGSQTLAFLGTLFVLLAFDVVAVQIAGAVPERIGEALLAISPNRRLLDFARGLIDTGTVVYFVAASVFILTLATVALESRRWR